MTTRGGRGIHYSHSQDTMNDHSSTRLGNDENNNGKTCKTKNIVPEKDDEKQLNPGSFVKISNHLQLGGTVEFPLKFLSLS